MQSAPPSRYEFFNLRLGVYELRNELDMRARVLRAWQMATECGWVWWLLLGPAGDAGMTKGDWLGGLGAVGFVVRHGPPTDSGPAHHERLVRPRVVLRGRRDPSGYLDAPMSRRMTKGDLGMTRGAS